jgi:uncharacterized protein (DUF58 family)
MRRGFKSRYYEPQKLARIRNLQLLARSVVEGYISGLHRSPFKGFSAEFAEYRQYLPGDDLKHFAWKVYARSDKRYVRQFEEETNLTCTLLVDASGSMAYGAGEMRKFDYACGLAAAITYLMIRQRDRVGLVVFGDDVRLRVPPSSSPAHMRNVLEQLDAARPEGETAIASSLHTIAEGLKRRGLVIVISDLIDEPEAVLSALNHFRHDRNEVIVFHLFDPAERALPFDGLVDFVDLETGQRMQVRSDVVRANYQARFDAFVRDYQEGCAAARVDHQLVSTDVPYERMLAAYLNRREKCR